MQETLEELLGYLRGTWHHRWLMIAVAWLVAIPGWVAVNQLPDQYKASARVYIDTESLLKPLLRGIAVDINIRRRVELITKTLASRPNIEKVVRMSDLDLRTSSPAEFESLVNKIEEGISLSGTGRENLYTISFAGGNGQEAKSIVQSLLTILVESTLGEARKDTDSAREFLDKQIADYENRLKDAEDELATFKVNNAGNMPSDGGDYYQRLQTARSELQAAQLQLREAERRHDALSKQLSGEEPTFGLVTTPAPITAVASPLDNRIRALELKLDELLLSFTEQHPDIQAIYRTIASLEKQKRLEQAKNKRDQGTVAQPLETNPVYQQLKISLSEADATVASIRVRVDEFKRRVNKLKNSVDTIPKIEAELKRLNRDYAVNKQQYNELLQRRESARISEDVDQTADSIKFRVIDPPRAPTKPSGPKRQLFSSAVFIVALGAGIALAFLMSQIRSTFDSKRKLKDITNRPVLGSVSMVWTDKELQERKKKLLVFIASCAVLFLTFLGVLGFNFIGMNAMNLAFVDTLIMVFV